MQLKTTLCLIGAFILISAQCLRAQENYKRIKISGSGQAFINQLAETGVDLRCGAIFTDHDVQLEVSELELAEIQKSGLGYSVLIDDLTAFYAERAQRMLPIAQKNLEIEKQFARFQKTTATQNVQAVLAKKPERLITRGLDSIILGNVAQADTLMQEIDWVVPQNYKLGSMGGMMTVSELENELDLMRSLFPNLITVKAPLTAERTWQNRPVWYVKISDNPDTDENEPETLMTSLIHAREVSSININLMFMWYLLENYATDPFVKNIVDNSEMFFIPMVNPDGVQRNFDISSSGGGMQRKNLRNVCAGAKSDTQGTDLNRNFDYWYAFPGGSSSSNCSQSYRGPNAFSEPESRMLRDFVLAHQFETVQMHHSFANSIPHPYGGNPSAVSGREAEYHKFHEDLTQYNRYIFGATVFPPAAGIVDDWMLGGAPDNNSQTGSGQAILGTTPESGARDGSEGGFWPNPAIIPNIAKRGLRINFINVLYAMKFAVLHDLTPVHLNTLTPTLQWGIERLGQTAGNFTVTVTPVSPNIVSVTQQPATQNGMNVLEQRTVTAQLQLSSGIRPFEEVEFIVKLSNEDHDLYEAKITKIFTPTVLFRDDNVENGNLNNWTTAGGSWVVTTADSFNGTRSISDANTTGAYGNNLSKTLTLNNTFNFSTTPGDTIAKAVVNFYTRWDLERNFDFVEFQASLNGSPWTPVLGRYNKPASNFLSNDHANKDNALEQFQPNNGTLLYDGDRMDKWVMEQVVIDSLHNSFLMNQNNVRFRFLFRTDGNNVGENYPTRFDGFYIDDFTVTRIQPPPPPITLSVDDLTLNKTIRVFPNPFFEQIQISWNTAQAETFTATLYDIHGRMVKQEIFDNGSVQTFSVSPSLSQGVYLLKLESMDGIKYTEKLVRQ